MEFRGVVFRSSASAWGGARSNRWISRYDRARAHALADLKSTLEQTAMPEDAFVYTTYIRTTPQRLWQALTDPAFTARYWGATFDGNWAVGSQLTWHYAGVALADPEQVVLESDPFRRLAYTWHTFTPEWAAAAGIDADALARFRDDTRSKVSFDISETEDGVKLTVIHDGLKTGSTLLTTDRAAWTLILYQ